MYCVKSDMTTSFTSTVQLIEINGKYYLEIPKGIITLFSLKTPKKFKLVVSENDKQKFFNSTFCCIRNCLDTLHSSFNSTDTLTSRSLVKSDL